MSRNRFYLPLIGLLLALPGTGARAGQAEAREAANSANCKPDKIDVVRQTVGNTPETVYKITCQDGKNLAVLVRCQGRLCTLLR